MKVGILTSSRADYGIYLPLLEKIHSEPFFELQVIAFGMHLHKRYGQTVNQIIKDGFHIDMVPGTMPEFDEPSDIAFSMGKTTGAFARFFNEKNYDLIFALGDRYEMFSAVAATAPFNIPVAHIHGGETTLGSIDNAFRHAITCFSKFHFTSTEIYQNRVKEIIGSSEYVYNVGALSIDNLKHLKLLDITEFRKKYGIDLSKPTILFTFHPETVDYKKNENYITEIITAFEELKQFQIIITMPNSDIKGLMIRQHLKKFAANRPDTLTVETFGTLDYLSAIKNCSFMLGNTSSGFVESAFFPKWVINLGNRQKGRIMTENIIQTPIIIEEILKSVEKINNSALPKNCNIYGDGKASDKIISIIKNTFKANG